MIRQSLAIVACSMTISMAPLAEASVSSSWETWMIQGGALGILAFIVFQLMVKTLPDLLKSVREQEKSHREAQAEIVSSFQSEMKTQRDLYQADIAKRDEMLRTQLRECQMHRGE